MMNLDFSAAQRIKRFPCLDAARGAACAGVVACHCDLGHWFHWYWGVMDFFFVMSGFLITRSLVANCDKGRGVFPFLLYRALRLLPAYVTVMLIYEITVLALGIRQSFQTLPYLLFYQHTDLLLGRGEIFTRIPEFLPYWSLILEEHFYLFWGLFFCLFAYARLRITVKTLGVAVLLLAGAAAMRKVGTDEWTLPGRFDGFLVGSLAGIMVFLPRKVCVPPKLVRPLIILLGLTTTAAAARLVWTGWLSYVDIPRYGTGLWLDASCFALVSLSLVLAMVRIDMRGLHFGPLQDAFAYMGLVSYEIYLLHFPIVEFLKSHFSFNFDFGKFLLYAITLFTATLLSQIMHRTMTSPALRSREQLLAFISHRFRLTPWGNRHAPATPITEKST